MPSALVHTEYSFDQPGPFFNFDVYQTWKNEPTTNTGIYAGFQFWFQNGGGGYFGTQVEAGAKKAIFSIWDAGPNVITALPTGNCNRFGHEGSGTQCIIPYAWVAGHEYRLRIWVLDKVNGTERWLSTIRDMTTNLETTIGVIALSDNAGFAGYGWLTAGGIGFLEHYGSGDVPCASLPYAKMAWRGPYANNDETFANTATAAFNNPTCLNSNISATHAPNLTQESGGGVVRTIANRTSLWGTPSLAPVCTLTANPTSVPKNRQFTLVATCNPTVAVYSWTGGTCTGNTSSTCTVTPASTATYSVTGTNNFGSSTASVDVAVKPVDLTPILMLLLD